MSHTQTFTSLFQGHAASHQIKHTWKLLQKVCGLTAGCSQQVRCWCCTAVADLGAGTCLAEASSGVLGELVPFQAAVSYFSVQHQQFDHCLITSLPFLLCLLVCICSKVSLWYRRHVLSLTWPAVRSTCSSSWKILRHLSCSGACWGMQTGQCFGGPLSSLQCISAVGRPSHHVILWNDNGWGQQLFRGHGSTALVHPCISSLLQALCTKGRASASAAPLQASLTTSPATVVPCLAALMCQQQLSLQLLRQQRAWQPSVQRSSS